MRTKKALESAPGGLVVLADSGTAKANVVHLLQDEGFSVRVEQSGEEYRISAVAVGSRVEVGESAGEQ